MDTTKKIALVTGGSRGLGKNMAMNLAQNGIDVILTYQHQKEEALATVEEIQKLGLKAAALALNVGDIKSLDNFVTTLQATLQSTFATTQLDFLINNAGIGIWTPFQDTSEEQFDALMNIHFKGTFFLTQKVLPILADGGGIVNISTGLTRVSKPGYSAYASMKGAMETLTKYQAQELGTRKIRVNVVAPGAIETDFGGGIIRDNPQANAMVASSTALGRAGLPEDIGGVVSFLCTEAARWINGQRIEVSGGMSL